MQLVYSTGPPNWVVWFQVTDYSLKKNHSYTHLFIIKMIYSVIWYQVFLSNANNFQTVPFDGTITGTTTQSKS